MEIHPNCLLDEMIHVEGFGGQDFGIMELDAVFMIASVL
jgi:hypothetical protein